MKYSSLFVRPDLFLTMKAKRYFVFVDCSLHIFLGPFFCKKIRWQAAKEIDLNWPQVWTKESPFCIKAGNLLAFLAENIWFHCKKWILCLLSLLLDFWSIKGVHSLVCKPPKRWCLTHLEIRIIQDFLSKSREF